MIYHHGTPVREVILHTSATPGDWQEGKTVFEMRDAIRDWHVNDNGWNDIGYHYVVAPNGDAAAGRPITEPGAHVGGHNTGTLGICMIPVRTHNGIKRFKDYFTPEQGAKVRQIIAMLDGIERVAGHNNYAAKECPGFWVKSQEWLPQPEPPNWLQRMWRRWT